MELVQIPPLLSLTLLSQILTPRLRMLKKHTLIVCFLLLLDLVLPFDLLVFSLLVTVANYKKHNAALWEHLIITYSQTCIYKMYYYHEISTMAMFKFITINPLSQLWPI